VPGPDDIPEASDPDLRPPDTRLDTRAGSTLEPSRPGAGTFTIEGRRAPALFVGGWLGVLLGAGAIVVSLLGGGAGAAPIVLIVGLVLLSVGLVAGAGSQAIERRARGQHAYVGPSPFLVFAAVSPTYVLAAIVIGIPLAVLGLPLDGPLGRLASVSVQAVVYVALIRLLVVDMGALDWREMGVTRPDLSAVRELIGGALWAAPVILLTIPIAAVLAALFPVTPVSPLPPAGEVSGFVINLIAGVIVAPIGEELLFRGFSTTAWVRDIGIRRGLVRGALFFAVAHVLTVSGGTATEALALATIGFVTRIPVALALGWLFLRRGSIWAPIGLHAAFNGILLILGEAALRSAP
jgi:membrane protease YdiL (CAAX protease family)